MREGEREEARKERRDGGREEERNLYPLKMVCITKGRNAVADKEIRFHLTF